MSAALRYSAAERFAARGKYPAGWRSRVVPAIRARSGSRCEGSPAFPDCRAVDGEPHPRTGRKVWLATAHLDHMPPHCEPENLRHWCPLCHATYDLVHATEMAALGRAAKRRETQPELPGFEPLVAPL